MESLHARQWFARLSLLLVALSAGVLLAFAGPGHLWLLLITASAVVVSVAAAFWFLLWRGRRRWLALGLALGAPTAVVIVFIADRLLWVALLALGMWALSLAAGRSALRPDLSEWALPVSDAEPPRRPFVVMNPRSGGGKVERFHLVERAEELGAEVALLDRPGIDVQRLARDAVARGADLLGVAGGDGTQALVAEIAAEHDVPLMVLSAGTRNHFALDLGLDRSDPARGLEALHDGVEARIDLGEVNGRPFVNNASFGAYAEIVENPAYRDDKARVTLDALPDLLAHRRGASLAADVGGQVVDRPQALLVSNNPYEDADLAGIGRRARLDRGVLGVIAVRVDTTRQAVALLNGARRQGVHRAEAREVVVTADVPEIPVGIDGETVRLPTPVHCTIRPGALRVRLPRDRPGIRPPRTRPDWASLWALALGRSPAPPSPAAAPPMRTGAAGTASAET